MSGEIIGINTAIVSDSGTNAGLGMSIPSNIVKRVVKQLIEGGKAIRGFIGLGFRPVDAKIAAELRLPDTKGALVEIVVIDGPADVAGIEAHDFIVSIGDKPIANSQELRHIVADIAPGTTVPVELYRDGELQILSVKMAVQPENLFRTPRP
jgi:S1-C subfamily serine protease